MLLQRCCSHAGVLRTNSAKPKPQILTSSHIKTKTLSLIFEEKLKQKFDQFQPYQTKRTQIVKVAPFPTTLCQYREQRIHKT
jgi:hypothetical protein